MFMDGLMPNSPYNASLSASKLRIYLEEVLPDAQLSDAIINSAYQPLLLLQTNHVMAVFAFSNGDMRNSYDALYGGFKKYYTEQRGQWDSLDIAFVFCVQPDTPNLDHFCSKVKTDVYFCRKFVVSLTRPLDTSLARLPFLPLAPLDGQSLRPASAQTFLQQCGVPALLAKLVVQKKRSPANIVKDCTSGKFDEPQELTLVANAPVEHSDRPFEPTRLETVTIKNFRAYRKPQTFELGADVTILYGPNGFGKTSFFDAVDFAITGEIGRISSSDDAHFKKTAQHLDSNSEESVVLLSFQSNGTVREVTRNVSNRKKPLLDGHATDRKAVLAELTGGNALSADRVENFIRLFRATHLFSQEQQELIKDFQNDCQLSKEIVSRMLAFDDYNNAVNKAAKVREVLQVNITDAITDIREISEQIADEKKELKRLGQTAKVYTNVEILNTELESLRQKLAAVGITAASVKPDAAMVRGWRASLESRHAESQSRNNQLSSLIKDVAGLPRMRADLAKLQIQITQKEHALNVANEKQNVAELEIQQVEKRLAETKLKCIETKTRAELLEWIRTTKPLYAQLIEKQRVITGELNRAADALAQHHVTEKKAASDLRTQENLEALASEKLRIKRTELAAVQSLNESLESWQFNSARLSAVIESEQAQIKSLESLRVEERELSPQLTSVNAEVARMSREIAEIDKSHSELNKLLSQLQSHVRTGTCPLCGEDHGSKNKLVRRIQECVTADAASGARANLIVLQERAKQLAEQTADNKQKQQVVEFQLVDLKKERARLDTEIGQFADSAAKLGVVLDGTSPTLIEQLQERHNKTQEGIDELNRQIQETGTATEAVRTKLANTKALVEEKAVEVADQKVELSRLQEEACRLRDDPRLIQVELDIGEEQLVELERLNREHRTRFEAEAVEFQTEVAQKKSEVSSIRQESTTSNDQLTALRNQLANLKKSVTLITARIKESKLPEDTSEEMLLSLIAEEAWVQTQFLALRDSASNIEMAIDAATTAAALTRLHNNVRDKEKKLATATRQRDQHQPWLKYFEELSRLVSSQQNEAIDNFTREYGPRTSVIQRRLRSVYGFDEIEILSRESAISVRVKRHGEELRPNDYFSQSQLQTLFLGLFLTACISQTWSTFSPVFLDDPVTHFDDLNTYALLDLIVGLLESEVGRRQFIISTCDEKLLQLARQKFSHFGDRARFYRFSAISAEGPVVDEVPPPQGLPSVVNDSREKDHDH